jgi:uncharacterized protein
MLHQDILGTRAKLTIRRFGSPGAFLVTDPADAKAPTILLPGAEVPKAAAEGDELEVFVYLDSEDRPVATLREPKVMLGEVAFLPVMALAAFGAFVDWGLPKELLVPLGQQTRPLAVGDRHPIGIYLDDTGRLAGTMRVSEMLEVGGEGDFSPGEWVEGEAWRKDPEHGVFVIIERKWVGLLPEHEPNTLTRGQAAEFRVSTVLPDGKVELSLRAPAHEQIGSDADLVLAVLGRPGAPRVGDRSSPEEIRATFGLSRKAFKRAAGRLLRLGQVRIDARGALEIVRR